MNKLVVLLAILAFGAMVLSLVKGAFHLPGAEAPKEAPKIPAVAE